MYIDPNDVVSPKRKIKDLEVIFNGGQDSFSLCKFKWDKVDSYGIRYNGSDLVFDIGEPKSREYPLWYVLPVQIGIMLSDAIDLVRHDSVINEGTYLTSCLNFVNYLRELKNVEIVRNKLKERELK